MAPLRTPAQAKAWLLAQGITVKDFAEKHQLNLPITYQLLAGTIKGRNGQAHRAAVLLGIKDGVVTD